MAVRASDPEVDYTKSTGAFPLDTDPAVVYEPDPGVDYSKSTDAFPMYDDRPVVPTYVDAEVKPTYTTPGPSTHGYDAKAAALQRQELGLSPDLSGNSDAGYAARPSTVTAAPAPAKKVVDPPAVSKPKAATQATGK